MDSSIDIRSANESDERPEYVAPKIVDYGDLVALTATIHTSYLTDVPMGSPVNVS